MAFSFGGGSGWGLTFFRLKLSDFPSIRDFAIAHRNADVRQLLLQKNHPPGFPIKEAALQIQARQKAEAKLPAWFANQNICYPSLLSLEQCSSATTANFKANLLQGDTIVDLTGGMGVDAAAFSARFREVIYLERNADLQEITAHNLAQLGVANVQCINADSVQWLRQYTGKADWVYLDPARRGTTGGKVVGLQECEPEVLALKKILFRKARNILLKASPMLDIDLAVSQLENVRRVYVVAVENEVKELLFHLDESATGPPEIVSVNLPKPPHPVQEFSFDREHESAADVRFSVPQQFLYEPNAAVLKAGAFRSVAAAFGVEKLHPNSHLYTSGALIPGFPGRSFIVLATLKLDKKQLEPWLPEGKANIAVRNFPMTVAQIRQQTGLKDGGDKYLFATTDLQKRRIVLVCEKAGSDT